MAIVIKRNTATVELCTDLTLVGEHEALTEKVAENRKRGLSDARITGDPDAARIVELEKLMDASVLVFTLRALPRKRWVELQTAHPAREGDEIDAHYGVNIASFPDAAMPESIESVVDKTTGETVDWGTWDDLADQLSDGQWQAFAIKLMYINNARGEVPFSKAVSRKTENSAAN